MTNFVTKQVQLTGLLGTMLAENTTMNVSMAAPVRVTSHDDFTTFPMLSSWHSSLENNYKLLVRKPGLEPRFPHPECSGLPLADLRTELVGEIGLEPIQVASKTTGLPFSRLANFNPRVSFSPREDSSSESHRSKRPATSGLARYGYSA